MADGQRTYTIANEHDDELSGAKPR